MKKLLFSVAVSVVAAVITHYVKKELDKMIFDELDFDYEPIHWNRL